MIGSVLIVDDSRTARKMIRRILEICGLEGIRVFEASNGIEALDLLKTQTVDLILTDLNMPEMDGEQLLKRVKSSPKLFDIPVIVITSLKNDAHENQLICEHAKAVLSKPVAIPEMHNALHDDHSMYHGEL